MTDKFAWGLLAVSGDCSAHGMSDEPCFIPIHEEDLPLISDYLRKQQECAVLCMENWFKNCNSNSKWKYSHKYQNAMAAAHDLGNELIERKVFHHKYHKRTEWRLVELQDDYPLNLESGAKACWKGEV